MRWLAGVCAGLLLSSAPAHAGTAGALGITVTIPDVQFVGYGCTSAAVTVTADVPEHAVWLLTLTAAPTGGQRLDGTVIAGLGPDTVPSALLICPADSAGQWSAAVDSQVMLDTASFAVAFEVHRMATATSITNARSRASLVRVRGSVLTPTGVAGRAPLSVLGRRHGKWRMLGHTATNRKGNFTFAAPRRVRAVAVEYPGDTATLASRAQTPVQRPADAR